jgi:hypothetical protein
VPGRREGLKILCNYTATPHCASSGIAEPRVVLNRLAPSFNWDDQSHMLVELTFTNRGTARISDAQTAYLAIEDGAGQNYMRRSLPQVDFPKLAPGERLTFSARLLAPALRLDHDTVQLCMPNSDPSLKFDPVHNFLLSSMGVANPDAGLNKLAARTVVP